MQPPAMSLAATPPSSMTTSGAPEPACVAVENLVYSSLPAPVLVQQIWTSLWFLLNRSTTGSKFGYQAHMVTCLASGCTILFWQLAAAPLPPEHPVSAAIATAITPPAARSFFIGFPFAVCDTLVYNVVLQRCKTT